MLTLYSDEQKSSCFKFIGMDNSCETMIHLISDNTSLIAPANNDGGMDTCSFYSGPSDATIVAFCNSSESCGSIAYMGSSESCGSIAYSSGGESCGSIASSSSGGFSSGSFSGGGGCSYSC